MRKFARHAASACAVVALAAIFFLAGQAFAEKDPSRRIAQATSVIAYRITDQTNLDLTKLHFDAKAKNPNVIKLSSSAARDLIRLVINPGTYIPKKELKYVTACPFVPEYAYEFRSPHGSPVWWLVAIGCGRGAVVETKTPPSKWLSHARYLSAEVLNALKKCKAGSSPTDVNQPPDWLWSKEASCLSKQG